MSNIDRREILKSLAFVAAGSGIAVQASALEKADNDEVICFVVKIPQEAVFSIELAKHTKHFKKALENTPYESCPVVIIPDTWDLQAVKKSNLEKWL